MDRLEKNMMIVTSRCDFDGRLGVDNTFSLFMDIATEHAAALRVGIADISERKLFWLASRTKIRFLRRPSLEEDVTLATFPERPKGVRCNRDYILRKDDETLVLGKTEWAILDTESGRLVRGEEVFPPELTYENEPVDVGSFARVRDNFADVPVFAEYQVRSTDIDLGGHMNNAAYPRALMSVFSSKERRAADIREMDVRFVSPCYEGDVLMWQKRGAEDGATEIRAFVKTGGEEKTILLVKIV